MACYAVLEPTKSPLEKPALSDAKNTTVRLQKALADAGVGSRRDCEELILEGRVDVDRDIVTKLGTKVDPTSQTIRVDGVSLKLKKRKYFAVHKPPGVLSTSKDQWRRTRVIDLVASKERLFTIGRLDKASSGLILVTNDGELANQVTHPRYKIEKTYHVTVAGVPKPEVIQKLRRGVTLSDGRVKPVSISIKKRLKSSAILEVVLAEGRNREIRRMLARFDHKVMTLRRVSIGSVRLGDLPVGSHRELSQREVNALRNATSSRTAKPKKKTTKRQSKNLGAKKAKKKKKVAKGSFSSTTAPRTGSIIGGDSSASGSSGKSKRPTKRKAKQKKSGSKRRKG